MTAPTVEPPAPVWRVNEFGCQVLDGLDCSIWLQERPHYCDRGRWLAYVEPVGDFARDVDSQDGWPRYYFDLVRAKLECEAWMRRRGRIGW